VTHSPPDATPVPPRGAIAWGLVRAAFSTAALGALYFVLPLKGLDHLPLGVGLGVAITALFGVTAWQVAAISRADLPGVRAIEALAVTVPLFLLLFAASYVMLSRDDPTNFTTGPLTRIDALYFTVTVFATVGFGDVAATSQLARGLVTVQMMLDLLIIGLGIRVFVGAVERGRSRRRAGESTTSRP
jgi:hypothetical protein